MKNRIRELRKQMGWTQEVLAPKLGVAQNSLSCWETEVSEPDNATLCKLADLFNCSVDFILCRTNDKNFSGLKIDELFDIGKFNPSLPLRIVLNSKTEFFKMFGEKQTTLLRNAAESGIYFYFAEDLVSYSDLSVALKIANDRFPFVDANGVIIEELPKSILGIIKIDGDTEYVIMNKSPLCRVLQESPVQEETKLAAFRGTQTTTTADLHEIANILTEIDDE